MAEGTARLALHPSKQAERQEKPADARWAILAFLLAVTVINFIDRQTLSVLAPKIRELLHLSHAAYGRIVAAFQFGMMSGEFGAGRLLVVDRHGPARLCAFRFAIWAVALLDGNRRMRQLFRRGQNRQRMVSSRRARLCHRHI